MVVVKNIASLRMIRSSHNRSNEPTLSLGKKRSGTKISPASYDLVKSSADVF